MHFYIELSTDLIVLVNVLVVVVYALAVDGKNHPHECIPHIIRGLFHYNFYV